MRRTPATLALAACVLLCVTGCGTTRSESEPGRRVTSTQAPAFTAPMRSATTSEPGGLRTTSITAACGDRTWAFGFTPVEPALGNRYLSVQVRNCASRPATVPSRPRITTHDSDGETVVVQWDWRTPMTSLTVQPGHDVWLRLHWHTSGRCDRGAADLEVAVAGDTAHLQDCLQLGGLSHVTGEATTADATWTLSG